MAEPTRKRIGSCPRCASASLSWVDWLSESFERWYCACGATGRALESGCEEVPLPASLRRSAPPQSSGPISWEGQP